jgi:hypothetical protein
VWEWGKRSKTKAGDTIPATALILYPRRYLQKAGENLKQNQLFSGI